MRNEIGGLLCFVIFKDNTTFLHCNWFQTEQGRDITEYFLDCYILGFGEC